MTVMLLVVLVVPAGPAEAAVSIPGPFGDKCDVTAHAPFYNATRNAVVATANLDCNRVWDHIMMNVCLFPGVVPPQPIRPDSMCSNKYRNGMEDLSHRTEAHCITGLYTTFSDGWALDEDGRESGYASDESVTVLINCPIQT